MLGTVAHPEGITNPPIDDLLEKVDSKYGLVIDAAKRARQINTYSQQLESNQLEVFGPLVEVSSDEKPLGIALREIAADKLEVIPGDVARERRAEVEAARLAASLTPEGGVCLTMGAGSITHCAADVLDEWKRMEA